MRAFGILLCLGAVGLGWLSFGDRRSPLALGVVELDGRLGVPLAAVFGLIGLILVVLPRRGERPAPARPAAPAGRPAAPARPRAPARAGELPAETEGWLAALGSQIARLPLEQGAKVVLDAARVPPIQLVLERQTQERARRGVETFGELLAAIPTPPRASIRFEGCIRAGPPWQHQVVAALRRSFPSEAFSATQHEETVEIVFRAPDARWQEAARAGALRRG